MPTKKKKPKPAGNTTQAAPGKPFTSDDPRINRTGRPKMDPAVRKKIGQAADGKVVDFWIKAVEKGIEILDGADYGKNTMAMMRAATNAAEHLANRHWGKTPTELELTVRDVKNMSDDRLKALFLHVVRQEMGQDAERDDSPSSVH